MYEYFVFAFTSIRALCTNDGTISFRIAKDGNTVSTILVYSQFAVSVGEQCSNGKNAASESGETKKKCEKILSFPSTEPISILSFMLPYGNGLIFSWCDGKFLVYLSLVERVSSVYTAHFKFKKK